VANQLVKSEIRFRQSGKIIGLTTKEFWRGRKKYEEPRYQDEELA
jgi:hypothetical protein